MAVVKFGSSLLDGPDGYRVAAGEVRRHLARGVRVVAVCSARRGVTDTLVQASAAFGSRPPATLVARLLATGEAESVALLGLALAALGVRVDTLDARGLGLRTRGPRLDADPVDVDVRSIRARLEGQPVLVAPGFLGVDRDDGEPTVLGRGGSDLTALFLAHRMGADECCLVKDVDGLYPADPREGGGASAYREATWQDVLARGGGVVQPKAVRYAWRHRRSFRIAAPGGEGTRVGPVMATAS